MSANRFGGQGDGPYNNAPRAQGTMRNLEVKEQYGLTFDDFFLKPQLVINMIRMMWSKPSPIQGAVMPLVLSGMNLIVRAKNGTGKTGTYAVPLMEIVEPACPYIQGVIIVPTHELALQTSKVCMKLAEFLNVIIMCTTEETVLKDDIIRVFQKVHVIVATPKRLVALIDHGIVELRHCKLVILDEADELLANATKPMVERIVNSVPYDRQFVMYSATFPSQIRGHLNYFMTGPYYINLVQRNTSPGVHEFYIIVDDEQKHDMLYDLLGKLVIRQSMIFCDAGDPKRIELLAKRIVQLGHSCYYLHGQMQVEHRNRVLHDFTEAACRNIVCTDLFARGIDAPAVNVVINFDMPTNRDVYLHRVGRTGRFGQVGLVINFVASRDMDLLTNLQREFNNRIRPMPDYIPLYLYAPHPFEGDMPQPVSHDPNPLALARYSNNPHGDGHFTGYNNNNSYRQYGLRGAHTNRFVNRLQNRNVPQRFGKPNKFPTAKW